MLSKNFTISRKKYFKKNTSLITQSVGLNIKNKKKYFVIINIFSWKRFLNLNQFARSDILLLKSYFLKII